MFAPQPQPSQVKQPGGSRDAAPVKSDLRVQSLEARASQRGRKVPHVWSMSCAAVLHSLATNPSRPRACIGPLATWMRRSCRQTGRRPCPRRVSSAWRRPHAKALCVGCNYPSKAFGLAAHLVTLRPVAACLAKHHDHECSSGASSWRWRGGGGRRQSNSLLFVVTIPSLAQAVTSQCGRRAQRRGG